MGETGCDDDENVDQQRLRQCIAEEMARFEDCKRRLAALNGEVDRAVDRMTSGYQKAFGVVEINGVMIPVVVNGSIFRAVTVSGSGQAAQLGGAITKAVGNHVNNLPPVIEAVNAGDRQALQAALAQSAQGDLESFLNFSLIDPNSQPSQLQARSSFGKAFTAAKVFRGLVNTYNNLKDMIEAGTDILIGEYDDRSDSITRECLRSLRRIRELKNCDKGSNAWAVCNPGTGSRAVVFDADLEEMELMHQVEEIREKSTVFRARFTQMMQATQFLKNYVEGYHSSINLLRRQMDLSVEIEENLSTLSDEELQALVDRYAQAGDEAFAGFQTTGMSADGFNDALNELTEFLEVTDQLSDINEQTKQLQEEIDAEIANLEQGDAGVSVNIEGQPGMTAVMSGPGGEFVGYRFARASRVGDSVTFQGGMANFNAGIEDTLLSGSQEIEIETLSFEFTPFMTVDYDLFDEIPEKVKLAVGVPDGGTAPPAVDLLFPTTDNQFALPPGVPFFAKGQAEDDAAVYSTRFRLNDQPSEALGSRDTVDSQGSFEFSAYFLTPEIDTARGQTMDITVQTEAIDTGGMIGQSSTASITVDPDAPLLATITPAGALTSTGGNPVQFTATITDSGSPLPSPVWFVEGIPGGNDRLGTISPSGRYTPPAQLRSFITEQFEVQVVSESSPELIGITNVTVTEIDRVESEVAVLNLILPEEKSGRSVSPLVSVMGLFLPSDKDGRSVSEPVSVMGLFLPSNKSGFSDSLPVSVMGLFLPSESNGREHSPPIAVDNQP